MDIDEIKALMEAMAASDLSEMQVAKDGWTLKVTRGAAAAGPAADPVPAAAPPPRAAAPTPVSRNEAPAAQTLVRSPLSGVVHFRPAPDAPPFVEAGRAVAAGDVLCLVEAMKMFNEIRAERAGTVGTLLAEPGAEVEAGQPLLEVV